MCWAVWWLKVKHTHTHKKSTCKSDDRNEYIQCNERHTITLHTFARIFWCFIHRTCNGDNGKWINAANEKLPFHKGKGGAGEGGGGGLQFKGKGMMPFWPSHSCVSLVETRCHHLVSSLPCRDHRRLPHRLPPAPGPGRAGTLPTDRKGSCHYTTHWEYTANRQKGFLPRWDSANRQKGFLPCWDCQQTERVPVTTHWEYTANRQKGFPSLHNTLGIHCQQTERVPAMLGLCQQTERVSVTTQHTGNTLTANRQKGFLPRWDSANRQKGFPSLHNGNTLPTDRKGSHHYTTHWEYTANWQKGFPSLHNTLGIHCQQTERVPITLGLCQLTEWVPVTTQHWQYTSLKAKPHDALQPAT